MSSELARARYFTLRNNSTKPNHADEPTEQKTPDAEPDLDGTIAVKNGVVQVTKPKGNGKWPVVSPGRNVIVYYDNQLARNQQ